MVYLDISFPLMTEFVWRSMSGGQDVIYLSINRVILRLYPIMGYASNINGQMRPLHAGGDPGVDAGYGHDLKAEGQDPAPADGK